MDTRGFISIERHRWHNGNYSVYHFLYAFWIDYRFGTLRILTNSQGGLDLIDVHLN